MYDLQEAVDRADQGENTARLQAVLQEVRDPGSEGLETTFGAEEGAGPMMTNGAKEATMGKIRLVTEPTVLVLAETKLDLDGMNHLLDWVQDYRPECVPEDLPTDARARAMSLFPHHGLRNEHNTPLTHPDQPKLWSRPLTDSELLVELSGRNCYLSYGLKAGRSDNGEYLARMLFPDDPSMLPHASVVYHAKMTFFLAGISRRVSHELIRHYVGADRTEEGSPSQESTRYTFHPGHFAVPPYVLDKPEEKRGDFAAAMQSGYDRYFAFIEHEELSYEAEHRKVPTGIERKRIYEAAAGLLPMQACTSMVWTTNPLALGKLFKERCSTAADREFQRFANQWRSIAIQRWPNLFR